MPHSSKLVECKAVKCVHHNNTRCTLSSIIINKEGKCEDFLCKEDKADFWQIREDCAYSLAA